ncbi:MAG: dynamin family protein [Flavobacterium sp.]|nr:dynamin family protein [Flavobacterium sp.]
MNIETIIIIFLAFSAFVTYLIFKGKNNENRIDYNTQNNELLNIERDEIKKLNAQLFEIQKEKSKFDNQNLQANPNVIIDNQYFNDDAKLKDEIEGLEDQIEDLQCKIKKTKSENVKLSDEVNNVKKAKHILHEENQELIKNNKKHEEQINADQSSLNFINDILTAKNATNDDFENISIKTLAIVSHINNEVKNCLLEIDKNIQYPSDVECNNWRNLELKRWIKNKKVIAVVGEFSSGKTSIINRILLQDDPTAIPLPVSSKETTAIPTYISKGKEFNCQIYSPSEELKNVSAETFESLTKSILDKINISSLIKYFVVSYNNPKLENISIVDTPGFGSNNKEIIKRTVDVIKDCDALFWVIDPNLGELNQSSINVIKNDLDTIPLYIIINKCDTLSPNDLDLAQNKIELTIEKNEINIEGILRFSNNDDVAELLKLINQVQGKNHIEIIKVVLDKIENLIKEKSTILRNELDQQRIHYNKEDVIKSKLKRIENDVQFSAENIERLAILDKSFWATSRDIYKIEQKDFKDFDNNLKSISTLSSNITKESENHSVIIKEQAELNKRINSIKNQLKNLQLAKENFIKAVKKYNPNLLN